MTICTHERPVCQGPGSLLLKFLCCHLPFLSYPTKAILVLPIVYLFLKGGLLGALGWLSR